MLHHIALMCSDRDQTVAFYSALGFHISEEYFKNGQIRLFMADDTTTLELFFRPDLPKRQSNPESYGLRHFAMKVTNIEECVSALDALGYTHDSIRFDSLSGRKLCFITDPDGQPVELHE